jgi:hypothetical protein
LTKRCPRPAISYLLCSLIGTASHALLSRSGPQHALLSVGGLSFPNQLTARWMTSAPSASCRGVATMGGADAVIPPHAIRIHLTTHNLCPELRHGRRRREEAAAPPARVRQGTRALLRRRRGGRRGAPLRRRRGRLLPRRRALPSGLHAAICPPALAAGPSESSAADAAFLCGPATAHGESVPPRATACLTLLATAGVGVPSL